MTAKTKLCKRCNKRRSVSKFHKAKSSKDGLQYACIDCNKKTVKNWQKENPEYWQTQKERSERISIQRRARLYGITFEQAEELSKTTHCEICNKELNSNFNIDHDHDSGRVRGVLCPPCNRGLGIFLDDTKLLESAIRYLKTHKPL